jgi:hypothetical protein
MNASQTGEYDPAPSGGGITLSFLTGAAFTALCGIALWEQIKFRMYRSGKKQLIAGEVKEEKAENCFSFCYIG